MKEIQLTQGKVALVDDEDYDFLMKFKWAASDYSGKFYVKGWNKGGLIKGMGNNIRMHRVIMNVTDSSIFIDHINGNPLDNRKSNLRVCTHLENSRNLVKKKNCSSQYKGVSWHKKYNKWQASIRIDGILLNLGRHQSEMDAAIAYDAKARELFGEFASPNFK